MFKLVTEKQLEGETIMTDYKFDCVYDYIDEVEEVVDLRLAKEIKELGDVMDKYMVGTLSAVFAVATILKVKPEQVAKMLMSKNMTEYVDEVNAEMDKLKAQKTKTVKTK